MLYKMRLYPSKRTHIVETGERRVEKDRKYQRGEMSRMKTYIFGDKERCIGYELYTLIISVDRTV